MGDYERPDYGKNNILAYTIHRNPEHISPYRDIADKRDRCREDIFLLRTKDMNQDKKSRNVSSVLKW